MDDILPQSKRKERMEVEERRMSLIPADLKVIEVINLFIVLTRVSQWVFRKPIELWNKKMTFM